MLLYVPSLSFAYSSISFQKMNHRSQNFSRNANEEEKREVAANFIIFYENKCAELWQFNEIICFSLAFSPFHSNCIMKIAFSFCDDQENESEYAMLAKFQWLRQTQKQIYNFLKLKRQLAIFNSFFFISNSTHNNARIGKSFANDHHDNDIIFALALFIRPVECRK